MFQLGEEILVAARACQDYKSQEAERQPPLKPSQNHVSRQPWGASRRSFRTPCPLLSRGDSPQFPRKLRTTPI